MYIVEVVACWKRWKRATFLGQTAVRMYCMAYRIWLNYKTGLAFRNREINVISDDFA